MLLTILRNIGQVIQKPLSPEAKKLVADEKILNHIRLNYSDSPTNDKYLLMKFDLEEILSYFNSFRDHLTKIIARNGFSSLDLSNFKKKKKNQIYKIPKKQSVLFPFVDENYKIITQSSVESKFSLDDLNNIIEIQLAEFDELRHDKIRMLIGNQIGTSIFFSPTLYCQTKAKKIKEYPLWKINFSYKFENKKLEEFFHLFPNLTEYKEYDPNNAEIILKFLISKLLLRAINEQIPEEWNLKKSVYIVPIIDGKWPYEIKDFTKYYNACVMPDESANKGLCEICGQYKVVEDGLTGDLGFYTKNQIGFELIGMKSGNLMCTECQKLAQLGLNYVQDNLEYFIAKRGTGKNPIMCYLVPYTQNRKNLQDLLNRIRKPTQKALKNIKTIGKIAKDQMKSPQMEEDNSEEVEDLLNAFGVDQENAYIYSFYIITFYHPEGQSSSYHNILDILHLNHQKCVKIHDAIINARNEGNNLKIRYLYHIFGINAVDHIRQLLIQEPLDMEKVCYDAFQVIKREFLEDIMKNVNKKQNSTFAIRKFNWYLDLAERLQLIPSRSNLI